MCPQWWWSLQCVASHLGLMLCSLGLYLLRLVLEQVPVCPECLEDVLSEPVGASTILTNIVKHIAEPLAGPSPQRLIDQELLAWINSE